MARYIELDKKKFARLRKEAQQFQDDIVCAVGTDFMETIAEAENRMIFDILDGLESEPTADVVEVVRCKDCIYKTVTEDGEYNPDDIVCGYHMSDGFSADDFCSNGKRMEEIKYIDCKHRMFSDMYCECSKGYKGTVQPWDGCEHGEKIEK